MKGFEREIGFYADVAPGIPIRLPRVWCGDVLADGSVLVMEDLSGLEALDQAHGVRHEQILAAVRAIAVVHARYWDDQSLARFTWLPEHDHFIADGYVEVSATTAPRKRSRSSAWRCCTAPSSP